MPHHAGTAAEDPRLRIVACERPSWEPACERSLSERCSSQLWPHGAGVRCCGRYARCATPDARARRPAHLRQLAPAAVQLLPALVRPRLDPVLVWVAVLHGERHGRRRGGGSHSARLHNQAPPCCVVQYWQGLTLKDDDVVRTVFMMFWLVAEPVRLAAGWYGNLQENVSKTSEGRKGVFYGGQWCGAVRPVPTWCPRTQVPWLALYVILTVIPLHGTCYYMLIFSFVSGHSGRGRGASHSASPIGATEQGARAGRRRALHLPAGPQQVEQSRASHAGHHPRAGAHRGHLGGERAGKLRGWGVLLRRRHLWRLLPCQPVEAALTPHALCRWRGWARRRSNSTICLSSPWGSAASSTPRTRSWTRGEREAPWRGLPPAPGQRQQRWFGDDGGVLSRSTFANTKPRRVEEQCIAGPMNQIAQVHTPQ